MENASDYGELWADIYDEYIADRAMDDPGPAVAFLLKAATTGPLLELGIGTGRIAIPLAGQGATVHGIEASTAMIAKLREKPGSERLFVMQADYSDFEAAVQFPLIFAALNAVLMLPERLDQLGCFHSVARALQPQGRFVLEAEIPDLSGFVNGMRLHLARMTDSCIELRLMQHRGMEQQLFGHHIWLRNGSIEMRPVRTRYANPSELDLMAAVAGLRLEGRFGGWGEEPFTAQSRSHVSVYRKD